MTETEHAYFAGLFDGEGSVVTGQRVGRNRALIFVNTDEGIIDWVAERYRPGSRGVKAPGAEGSGREHHKPLHRLVWSSKVDIIRVLDQIEPYLVGVKAELATILRTEVGAALGSGAPGVRRKTHCSRGHERPEGEVGRTCKECQREYMRDYRRKKKDG